MKEKKIEKLTFNGDSDYFNTETSVVNSAIMELSKKINAEKERLLLERLRLFLGEDVDLKKEIQRRFPRIINEVSDGGSKETYYWDNGNVDGMGFPIITFHTDVSTEINDFGGSSMLGFTYE